MKKSVLIILILLLLPMMAYAKPPVKPTEVIPKVIDANGKLVGYVLSTGLDPGRYYSAVLAMEYNGKIYGNDEKWTILRRLHRSFL